MSETTERWWKSETDKEVSGDEKVARIQRFFADNGEKVYGKPKTEKIVTLEDTPFTILEKYTTSLTGLDIVPMWAGKEVGWKII